MLEGTTGIGYRNGFDGRRDGRGILKPAEKRSTSFLITHPDTTHVVITSRHRFHHLTSRPSSRADGLSPELCKRTAIDLFTTAACSKRSHRLAFRDTQPGSLPRHTNPALVYPSDEPGDSASPLPSSSRRCRSRSNRALPVDIS